MEYADGVTQPMGAGRTSLMSLRGALEPGAGGNILMEYNCLPGQSAPFEAQALNLSSNYKLFSDKFRGSITGRVMPKPDDPPPITVVASKFLNMDVAKVMGVFSSAFQRERFGHMRVKPEIVAVEVRGGFRFRCTVPPFYRIEVENAESISSLPFFGFLGLKTAGEGGLKGMKFVENLTSTAVTLTSDVFPFATRDVPVSTFSSGVLALANSELSERNVEESELSEKYKFVELDRNVTVVFRHLMQARSANFEMVVVDLDNIKGQGLTGVSATLDTALKELTAQLNLREGVLRARDGFIRRDKHVATGKLRIRLSDDLANAISANAKTVVFDMSKTYAASRTQITFRGARSLTTDRLQDFYPFILVYPSGKPNSYVQELGIKCVVGYFDGSPTPLSRTSFTVSDNSGFLALQMLSPKGDPIETEHALEVTLVAEMADTVEQPLL